MLLLCYRCHPDDVSHIGIFCSKQCNRKDPECDNIDHICRKVCGADCGKCTDKVQSITLPKCGHTVSEVPCFKARNPEKISCLVLRECDLGCGHSRSMLCGDIVNTNLSDLKFLCNDRCNAELPCGHSCSAYHGKLL